MPKQASIQTLNALKKDPHLYEAVKGLKDAHNQLVSFVGPGVPVERKNLSVLGMGTEPTYSVSGTYSRGRIQLVVGTGSVSGASITLGFPEGTWSDTPFATVVQNGGTGLSPFSWTESSTQLVITLMVPADGDTYNFQYAIRN